MYRLPATNVPLQILKSNRLKKIRKPSLQDKPVKRVLYTIVMPGQGLNMYGPEPFSMIKEHHIPQVRQQPLYRGLHGELCRDRASRAQPV